MMSQPDLAPIVLAGAAGDLGGRILRELRSLGAVVLAPVRQGTDRERQEMLQRAGATVVEINHADADALARAMEGAHCVVSALNGLGETIVERQGVLLEGAVRAGVPRFIPSDFSLDYRGIPAGGNRNLDLRRRFAEHVDAAPIAATSIFNGAFADLLVGPMPLVLAPLRRVLYWGNPDVPIDFTTMDDTAAFTARAALEPAAPRALRIAGSRVSARELAGLAGEVAGKPFRLLRGGSLDRLEAFARIVRRFHPASGQIYPPWQGMQYLRDMFDGRAGSLPLDNGRFPALAWTELRQVLARGLG